MSKTNSAAALPLIIGIAIWIDLDECAAVSTGRYLCRKMHSDGAISSPLNPTGNLRECISEAASVDTGGKI